MGIERTSLLFSSPHCRHVPEELQPVQDRPVPGMLDVDSSSDYITTARAKGVPGASKVSINTCF